MNRQDLIVRFSLTDVPPELESACDALESDLNTLLKQYGKFTFAKDKEDNIIEFVFRCPEFPDNVDFEGAVTGLISNNGLESYYNKLVTATWWMDSI